MNDFHPLYLAGTEVDTDTSLEVRNPWDGTVVTRVATAGPAELEKAAAAAARGFAESRRLPAWRREEWLRALADLLAERSETFARALVLEAGKPLRLARDEVNRAVGTLRAAAAITGGAVGQVIPLDTAPAGEGWTGLVRRVPAGPVAGIAPFNFPLNLALHKVAPALAVGNTAVLKPAAATPITACLLAGLYRELEIHPALLSVVPCDRTVGAALVTDPRFKVLSFTGSPAVGWEIRSRAGRKHVALELGGNAPAIVHDDADLAWAAQRIVQGGFGFAGQSCISVQRVYVHRSREEELTAMVVAGARALRAGDPMDPETDLGPLIDTGAADRVVRWIEEARAAGARLLCGGERSGDLITPTVLTGVPAEAKVDRLEVFGPVVVVHAYDRFEEAVRRADASLYGLQAGVFTRDIDRVLRCWDELETGGLMVNDIPTFRVDSMPYGGVKESGIGREGPAWAVEHMTELRLLGIRRREG